ncbi:MAG: PIN domain-containing protein [Candidatus Hydrothermarchaeota archaeon]|nr:PIN domain-containing protein [Candidatus Hydrothermarchaeota archaeon]
MRCVDTTFLIDLLRNDPGAVNKAKELDESGALTTEVNIFELVFGIYRVKQLNHKKRLEEAEKLFNRLVIFPLDHKAAVKAGEILGRLCSEGREIDIPDGMTAAISLANGCNVVVTRNAEHFGRIPQVKVESY